MSHIVKLYIPSIPVTNFTLEQELFDMDHFYPVETAPDVEYIINLQRGRLGNP